MNVALIGPPGAGKGTHGEELVSRFDFLRVDTGELFRKYVEQRRAIGILAKKYLSRGELVPDELVDAMVEEWLWRIPPDRDILFDGFPRTVEQARFLDSLLRELEQDLTSVIYLKVDDDEVKKRLLGRMVCRSCQTSFHDDFNAPSTSGICDVCGGELIHRHDDIPEMVRVRLRAFHRTTGPLLNYYQETNRLVIIDGTDDIKRVTHKIVEVIEAIRHKEIPHATPEETAKVQDALKPLTRVPEGEVVQQSLDIVLVGGPGSGKGTQAEEIRQKFDLPHISTGDLFRENIKNGTELGKLAKSYIDRGDLVPDDVSEAMVDDCLSRSNTQDGFILDGFPRTLSQAEALTEILAEKNRRLSGVLYIKVSDSEIIKRLSGRLICRECDTPFHETFNPFTTCPYNKCNGEYLYRRDDDNPETVRSRLKTFHRQTAPLINYYRDRGLLIEIDGEGDVPEVTQRVLDAVQNLVIS